MCKYIDSAFIMPGWGCCRCRLYNGIHRPVCRGCGEAPCAPLTPDNQTGTVFATRKNHGGPQTRSYTVRRGLEWARIWITDDGCFTTLSDHGNFGYWWSCPGCEFRKFLCEMDDYYLSRKLAVGRHEFDGEASVKTIRSRICDLRRQQCLTREQAQAEWDLVHPKPSSGWGDGMRGAFSNMDNEIEAHEWYVATDLGDAAELLKYRTPMQIQMFIKRLWPLFVAQLREELAQEVAVQAQ